MSNAGISSGSSARACKMWNLDKTPAAVRRYDPLLGELRGLNDGELVELAERRVVY